VGAWLRGYEAQGGVRNFSSGDAGMWLWGVREAQGDAGVKGLRRMAQSTRGCAAHGGCGSSAPGMRVHGSRGVQLRGCAAQGARYIPYIPLTLQGCNRGSARA